MPVLEKKYPAVHSMLVATELTTEDMLDIFMDLAKKLTWKLNKAEDETAMWKHDFNMYRTAWLREMGGKLYHKSHDIDAFVKTAGIIYAKAQKWDAYEGGLMDRDPFWNVPEPKGGLL